MQVLQSGADDVLQEPFDMKECFARAQALMRRYTELGVANNQCYTLAFGSDLIIEPQYRMVTLKGERLELTRKEYDMLYYLARHAGQVLSPEQLHSEVWDSNSEFNVEDSIKAHIKSIRKKLQHGGKEYIQNVWGVGYRFTENDDK